jgi:hypothetical protein
MSWWIFCHPKEGELKSDSDAEDARFVPLHELFLLFLHTP